MRDELCLNIKLTKEQRVELLNMLVKRYGSIRKLAEKIDVKKSSLHRALKGEQVSEALATLIDYRICKLLSEDEFYAVINREQLLRALGLMNEKGVNVPLLLAILDAVLEREEAKQPVLELIARRYKADLQQLFGETLPKIKLEWTEEFEKWLREKKRKPISERTLKDYRNIWKRCLEGKTLGWHLLKQLEGAEMMCSDGEYHPTSWPRQIFRHYVEYLRSIGKLDWDTHSRLLLAVPSRKYGRKLSQKSIEQEDVIKSLEILREKRQDIYTLYLLILFSGARFEHALSALRTWSPDEKLYVAYLQRNIKRLECLDTHCRYYMGRELDQKPLGFIFFPKELLPMIEQYKNKLPNKRRIERVVKKLNCLMPKLIRIYAVREMFAVLGDNDVTRFILSKFSELSVSARHYRNLLEEADKTYPNYIAYLKEKSNTYLEPQ